MANTWLEFKLGQGYEIAMDLAAVQLYSASNYLVGFKAEITLVGGLWEVKIQIDYACPKHRWSWFRRTTMPKPDFVCKVHQRLDSLAHELRGRKKEFSNVESTEMACETSHPEERYPGRQFHRVTLKFCTGSSFIPKMGTQSAIQVWQFSGQPAFMACHYI